MNSSSRIAVLRVSVGFLELDARDANADAKRASKNLEQRNRDEPATRRETPVTTGLGSRQGPDHRRHRGRTAESA
jgi:hypothetical protein